MSNFGSGRCISRRLLQLPDVCSGLAAAVMQLLCVLQLPRENLTGAGVAPIDAAPGRGPDAAPWQNKSAAPSHPPAQLPRPARCSSHVRANAAPWRSSHAAPLVGRSSHGVVVHGRRRCAPIEQVFGEHQFGNVSSEHTFDCPTLREIPTLRET